MQRVAELEKKKTHTYRRDEGTAEAFSQTRTSLFLIYEHWDTSPVYPRAASSLSSASAPSQDVSSLLFQETARKCTKYGSILQYGSQESLLTRPARSLYLVPHRLLVLLIGSFDHWPGRTDVDFGRPLPHGGGGGSVLLVLEQVCYHLVLKGKTRTEHPGHCFLLNEPLRCVV